jgi:hypothetical protein
LIPGRALRDTASVTHQRPLKRHAETGLVSTVDATIGCGHIMVIAAAIAAASSSVGIGVIVPTLTFIASPPLNVQHGHAMFGFVGDATSQGIPTEKQCLTPSSS